MEGQRKFEVVQGNPRLELIHSLNIIAKGYKDGQYLVQMQSDLATDIFLFQIIHTSGTVRVGLGIDDQEGFRDYLIQNYPETFSNTNLQITMREGIHKLAFYMTKLDE